MSKADQLGTGRFGATARPVSARRAAIGAATGVPTEGIAPPTRLPLDRISANPDNPRTSLGDLAELAGSLREHGQKQAITVMNRDAYVRANPDREPELAADATHVVVDGSSRLAAAREAGLTHLNVMVDDDQGADAEAILESALVANVHRQELEPLDEARALQRLLAIHGTQTRLAKRLHKSQGWVSQRLALLNLAPALQERIGEERIDLLRAVGNKPVEEQETALEALKREHARAEAEKAERRRERQAAASAERDPAPSSDTPGSPLLRQGPAGEADEHAGTGQPQSATRQPDGPPDPDGGTDPDGDAAADGGAAGNNGIAADSGAAANTATAADSGTDSDSRTDPAGLTAGATGAAVAGGTDPDSRSDADSAGELDGAVRPSGSAEPDGAGAQQGPTHANGAEGPGDGSEPVGGAQEPANTPGPADGDAQERDGEETDGQSPAGSSARLAPVPATPPAAAPATAPSSAVPTAPLTAPSPSAAPVAAALAEGVPVPRAAAAEAEREQAGTDAYAPPRLPYDDGVFLAHHLIRKMPDAAFDKMLDLLNEHQWKRDSEREESI
ncbi:ParB/RepB/Spo0J family partition protein [Streptomyces sp. NPDC015220]|uniref:ParB/RepB/Spo0J family partition protein n=1 Tax=Streptomyces sp. NPDC015220 TaxID=3364947 RepID=UPI0036FF5891